MAGCVIGEQRLRMRKKAEAALCGVMHVEMWWPATCCWITAVQTVRGREEEDGHTGVGGGTRRDRRIWTGVGVSTTCASCTATTMSASVCSSQLFHNAHSSLLLCLAQPAEALRLLWK